MGIAVNQKCIRRAERIDALLVAVALIKPLHALVAAKMAFLPIEGRDGEAFMHFEEKSLCCSVHRLTRAPCDKRRARIPGQGPGDPQEGDEAKTERQGGHVGRWRLGSWMECK